MKGAKEYCKLFHKAEQHGRLYLLPHRHARGYTFHIYVLPEGEEVIENGGINPPLNKDAVEVYGIVGGQPGWTEYYGWLREGPWQRDFDDICKKRIQELKKEELDRIESEKRVKYQNEERIAKLLATYK